jgi:hypothetical protein
LVASFEPIIAILRICFVHCYFLVQSLDLRWVKKGVKGVGVKGRGVKGRGVKGVGVKGRGVKG